MRRSNINKYFVEFIGTMILVFLGTGTAVSLGVWLSGRMTFKDFIGYVVAQVIGAFAGTGLLSFVVNSSKFLSDYAADGYGDLSAVGLSMGGAFVVEAFLTFVFVLVILGGLRITKCLP